MSKRQFSEFSGGVDAKASADANDAISTIIKHAEDLLKAACAFKQDLASGKQPENTNIGESISEISRNLHPAVTYFASSPTQQSAQSHKVPKLDESQSPGLKLPAPTGLTAWTPSEICLHAPPLPPIKDPVLDKAAFTHSGMAALGEMSYERLEWVGDAYLEMFATIFIYQTFPNLPAGRCSQHRGQGEDTQKVLGDIFEAYVAGVILGDPEFGLARASSWMKALWSKELAKEIKAEYINRERLQQVAATQASTEAASGEKPPTPVISEDSHPKNRLVQRIGTKGVKIYYLDEKESVDKQNHQRRFTVGVYVDAWGESRVRLGFGSALSKREAGAKAAENAMENKKLMKKYEQKKKELEDRMNAQS
ncbi:hypothetical protein PG995_015639 [Apiospora arundinis]